MSKNKKTKGSKASIEAIPSLHMEFGQPEERLFFSEQFPGFINLLSNMGEALNAVFRRSVPANPSGITIFMLGKLCVDDFNEILLLCANGFGFGAMKILRGMFEKLVDARYLNLHPEEIEKFWNFHIVKLRKLKLEDVMKKTSPDWERIIDSFRTIKKKSGTLKLQQNWTVKDFVTRAEE